MISPSGATGYVRRLQAVSVATGIATAGWYPRNFEGPPAPYGAARFPACLHRPVACHRPLPGRLACRRRRSHDLGEMPPAGQPGSGGLALLFPAAKRWKR